MTNSYRSAPSSTVGASYAAPGEGALYGTVADFAQVPQDQAAYTVPSPETTDAPFIDSPSGGYHVGISSGLPYGTPDPYRLGGEPVRDNRPDTGNPDEYYAPEFRDINARESVTSQDADGWTETKDYPGFGDPGRGAERWAHNPRRVPPPEPRLTTTMAPRSYSFLRPFGSGLPKEGAKYFTGDHFSMADFRRNYQIDHVGGMLPQNTRRRNTYRLEPAPWDANQVDTPPDNIPAPTQIQPQTIEAPYESRSWRLT